MVAVILIEVEIIVDNLIDEKKPVENLEDDQNKDPNNII